MEYSKAVEISDKIWWVGDNIDGDSFQCHVYLIEDGEESILIDAGSRLSWKNTREKIEQVIPIVNIKYIICHHQDPDITSAIDLLLGEIGKEGKYIVTHWRTESLLKHYDWGVEFYDIDENNWILETKNRRIEFVFTPYMHFAGAFCSFDVESGVLFSSDIFGAFREKFQLFADDEVSYFEDMKPFHAHYMPSREIVINGLKAIKEKPFKFIAPQHGSIIPYELSKGIIERLSNLDVGLFLEYGGHQDVRKLTKANEILSNIFEIATFIQGSVYDELGTILRQLDSLFHLKRVISYVVDIGEIIVFDSELEMPYTSPFLDKETLLNYANGTLDGDSEKILHLSEIFDIKLYGEYQSFTFITRDISGEIEGLSFLIFEDFIEFSSVDSEILKHLKKPIHLLIKKELAYFHSIALKDIPRDSIDQLTGLFTKFYIDSIFTKRFEKLKKLGVPIATAMFSIKNIKEINARYGEDIGDLVIKQFAKILESRVRESDYLFRFAGNKFLVILVDTYESYVEKIVKDIQEKIKQEKIKIGNMTIEYDILAGVASLEREHYLFEFIQKVDLRLSKMLE